MDLLFSKYASPFILLDEIIFSNGFFDFVIEFVQIHNEKLMWECWLHKVFDKSFDDFKNSFGTSTVEPVTDEQIETTLKDSKNVLNSFIPD